MQATPPPQPHHSITRLTQSKLRSSHVHRGHGHPWTSNKNRTERGRRSTVVKLTKGLEQYANL